MDIIETQDGAVIDAIVHAHYGYLGGALELVMDANPFLWHLPSRLPRGLKIALPIHNATSDDRGVRLWDTS